MLQLLTATGARPEAFALCQKWAARQDYAGKVIWFIVDDGPGPLKIEKMPANWLQVVIRRAPFWQPGQNTQALNLLRGLAAIDPAHPVVIWEDDDWYAPDWLTHIEAQLERAEVVGEGKARYYNVATRQGRQLRNGMHASLCSTAVRGKAIETLRQACKRAPKFIDLDLWQKHRSRYVFDGHRVVGIKGMPGRDGIGMGHKNDFTGEFDPDGALLRQWIGDDARHYA